MRRKRPQLSRKSRVAEVREMTLPNTRDGAAPRLHVAHPEEIEGVEHVRRGLVHSKWRPRTAASPSIHGSQP